MLLRTCACQGSRARRERNAQHPGHTDWFCLLQVWEVLVISCGKCVAFQQMKNNFYLPCQLFENRRSMRMLLFLRVIDLTEHFIVKQKSILKHQKLLLQDVTLGSWVLKDPLIGKDQ